MGGRLSKSVVGGGVEAAPPPPPPPPSFSYAAEIRCYESTCLSDPDVQSFDVSLRRRTGGVIAAIATSGQSDALSFFSLKEIVHCLLETHTEAFTVILQSQSDIWKSPQLKSLVEDYFRSSRRTLDLCAALETAIGKLKTSQIAVRAGLDRAQDGSFQKALDYFGEFKKAGNPFKEFFLVFDAVIAEQLTMLDNLKKQRDRLDQKIGSSRAWRKISCVIFASVFVAALVCGVVLAAVAAPPAAAAAVGAASSLFAAGGGKWIAPLWNKSVENRQKQRELVEAMRMGTVLAIHDLHNVGALVESLELKINSVMDAVDFSLGEKDAVRVVAEDVRKHLEGLTAGAEDLRVHVEKLTEDVSRARALVLQKIINHPGDMT